MDGGGERGRVGWVPLESGEEGESEGGREGCREGDGVLLSLREVESECSAFVATLDAAAAKPSRLLPERVESE